MTFRSIYPGIVIGLGDIEGNEEKPVLTLPWVVDFYLYISKGVSLPNHIHALKRKMTIQIHLPCRGEIKHIGLTCFRSFLTPFLENVKRFRCDPSFLICQCDNILAIFRHITGFSSHGLWNLSIIDTIPFHFGSRSPNYTAYICLVRTPFLTQGHVDLMTQQSRVLPWSMLTWVRTNKWKLMWKNFIICFSGKRSH